MTHNLTDYQIKRLRAFALKELSHGIFAVNDDALVPLAYDPDPNAWRPWQETPATSGQWFWWRDPSTPDDLHVDQVEPNEATGLIEMKHGCGLLFYPECQPLTMPDDVAKAIVEAEKSYDAYQERERLRRAAATKL
jgi:hypothetical protein